MLAGLIKIEPYGETFGKDEITVLEYHDPQVGQIFRATQFMQHVQSGESLEGATPLARWDVTNHFVIVDDLANRVGRLNHRFQSRRAAVDEFELLECLIILILYHHDYYSPNFTKLPLI